ncbi:MAG: hypothetical protein DIKNOCCD_01361 [bacterium]|nr:hypothetical protein [bacterium]
MADLEGFGMKLVRRIRAFSPQQKTAPQIEMLEIIGMVQTAFWIAVIFEGDLDLFVHIDAGQNGQNCQPGLTLRGAGLMIHDLPGSAFTGMDRASTAVAASNGPEAALSHPWLA